MTEEPQVEHPQEPAEEPSAGVRKVADWHLVTYGTWEVSVAPDGLLMLPRHVHPREVSDFVGAMLAAAEVGQKVIEDNQRGTKEVGEIPSGGVVLTEGPPPPGVVRMPVTPRGDFSTIGRPKRREATIPDPRQPTPRRVPPNPPGVRNVSP